MILINIKKINLSINNIIIDNYGNFLHFFHMCYINIYLNITYNSLEKIINKI